VRARTLIDRARCDQAVALERGEGSARLLADPAREDAAREWTVGERRQ
jgi:hypothetical protein